MPGLEDKAGDCLPVLGIAQDEAVFAAVHPQPGKQLGVLQRCGLFLVIAVGDVHGQTAAVLIFLRPADDGLHMKRAVFLHGPLIDMLLGRRVGIAAGEIDPQPLRPGVGDHALQVFRDPCVHRHAADAHGLRRLLGDGAAAGIERILPAADVHFRLCLEQTQISCADRGGTRGLRRLVRRRALRGGMLRSPGIEHENKRAERTHPGPKPTLERQDPRPFPSMRQA